jgi:hypothetical protein
MVAMLIHRKGRREALPEARGLTILADLRLCRQAAKMSQTDARTLLVLNRTRKRDNVGWDGAKGSTDS